MREGFFKEFGLNHQHYSNLLNDVYLKASACLVCCLLHMKLTFAVFAFARYVDKI
jgi:hypothetical protein